MSLNAYYDGMKLENAKLRSENTQLRANVETLREALNWVANMPEYDQDDAHRLRNIAKTKLAATAPKSKL